MGERVISRVLMCEPKKMPDSVPYTINKWMTPGQSINQDKAHQQWRNLKGLYVRLGMQTDVVEQQPGQPDMVFAADQAIVRGRRALISRFSHEERQGETPHYRQWFQANGYETQELPAEVNFEGNGEMIPWNGTLFVGIGERSDRRTVDALKSIFPEPVVPLEIVDESFYHLDVGFFPLDKDTIFYYPPAYSEDTQLMLKETVPNLVPFTDEEAEGFSANSVVSGKHVIFQKGNDSFAEKVSELGYDPQEIDLLEFKKLGGGAHCLTNPIEYYEPNITV